MDFRQCVPTENIIRAIRTSDWDENNNRLSSSLFRGPKTSVSRTIILSLEDLQRIFCKDLHRPPDHRVVQAGEINVGELKKLGKDFKVGGKFEERIISVYPDPIKDHKIYADNPAHALIQEKLPRSLCLKINMKLKLVPIDSCGQKELTQKQVVRIVITLFLIMLSYVLLFM